jgi:hypothetical protein
MAAKTNSSPFSLVEREEFFKQEAELIARIKARLKADREALAELEPEPSH